MGFMSKIELPAKADLAVIENQPFLRNKVGWPGL
jgi:hypothetical protein